jgi:hypothetical protein
MVAVSGPRSFLIAQIAISSLPLPQFLLLAPPQARRRQSVPDQLHLRTASRTSDLRISHLRHVEL